MINDIKYSILPFVFLLFGLDAFAQTGYIESERIKVAGITTSSQVNGLTIAGKITTRTYLDGQGRVLQTVDIQASPGQKDVVQPVAYDNLGRQSISYLPYVSTSTDGSYHPSAVATEQPAFYQGTDPLTAKDTAPYAGQVFENSPLQRLLKGGLVGAGFQPGQHNKLYNFRSNLSTDNVINWSTSALNTGYYTAGTLSVSEATDEDGIKVTVFADLNGKTILKRQLANQTINGSSVPYFDTYYIYNESGALSYLVPPKAVMLMQQRSNWSLAQTDIANLIFSYQYDNLGRLVQKSIPDRGSLYVVYDPINRPVLMQDANLRAANKWNYIKYDGKGHAISQGIYIDAAHIGLSSMQNYVNTLNYSTAYYEERSSTAANGYYTNAVFPTTAIEPLAYSYYDDYDLDQNGTADYSYQSQGLAGEVAAASLIRGMPTMVRKRSVGDGLSNIWLINVLFYDKNGRPVQTQSNNHLNYIAEKVTDTKTSVYDFTGKPVLSMVSKQAGVATTSIKTSFAYDHMYRLLSVNQYYNGSATAIPIAAYTYNELGQQIKKQLNPGSGGTSLQSLDYRYNIRGQLLSINNSTLSNDGGVTNNDNNDVFGMQLLYDQSDANLNNTSYFSGKLSAIKWMSKDGNNVKSYERSYSYTYDILNRLTSAAYAERSGGTGSFNRNIGGFNENGISYDAGGNLLTLQRNSSTQGTNSFIQTDNLVYTYNSNHPNQLQSVTDGTDANHTGAGFMIYPGGSSSGTYSYDANGNLTADPYKGLSLGYNILGRTDRITVNAGTGQYISYTYDAGGALLRKQVYKTGSTTLVTDYSDGFVYNNNTTGNVKALAYFGMPEGRVRNDQGVLKLEYVITDQQGNARVSVQDNGSGTAVVRQENSYYAFGMTLPNSPVGTLSDGNKQLYNGGSEWQNDYGNLPDYQQTFYRNYDAALGRFVGVDPLAEGTASLTGYHYANNNPVMFNDPMGDAPRLNSFENTWQSDETGARGSSGFMDYGKLRYDKMMERSRENGGGFFWDSANGQFMPTENQINKVIAQYGGMRVVITPEIANVLEGRNLTFENGELGFYRYNGIKFFNEQHTGVTDADGHYLGNSYHTYTFVALQGGNQGGGVDNLLDYFDKKNGDISNYAAAIGYVSSSVSNWAANVIKSRSLYGVADAITVLRTPIVNIHVSTSALRTTGTTLGRVGIVAGGIGLGITTYQYFSGQITGKEALVDSVFGAIGFMGPIGAGISILYFGGKAVYEYSSGDTLFDKPIK
jgi:RHS repeat-associated protein